MNKKIHFHGMDSSQAIETYANASLERVVEFLKNEREPIYLDLTLKPGRPHAHHMAELRVKTAYGDFIASQEGPAMYQLIDMAVDSMYKQLHEDKRQRVKDGHSTDYYKGA
jgi:ribosomal subunit interface protein